MEPQQGKLDNNLKPIALGLIVDPPTVVLCYDLYDHKGNRKRRKRKMPLRNFTDRTNVNRLVFTLQQRHKKFLENVLPVTLEKMLRTIQEVQKGLDIQEAVAKVDKEYEINPEENLNLLPTEELTRKKEIMDEGFKKNLVLPGDPEFVYDKVVEFDATSCVPSAWDDDEDSKIESYCPEGPFSKKISIDDKLSSDNQTQDNLTDKEGKVEIVEIEEFISKTDELIEDTEVDLKVDEFPDTKKMQKIAEEIIKQDVLPNDEDNQNAEEIIEIIDDSRPEKDTEEFPNSMKNITKKLVEPDVLSSDNVNQNAENIVKIMDDFRPEKTMEEFSNRNEKITEEIIKQDVIPSSNNGSDSENAEEILNDSRPEKNTDEFPNSIQNITENDISKSDNNNQNANENEEIIDNSLPEKRTEEFPNINENVVENLIKHDVHKNDTDNQITEEIEENSPSKNTFKPINMEEIALKPVDSSNNQSNVKTSDSDGVVRSKENETLVITEVKSKTKDEMIKKGPIETQNTETSLEKPSDYEFLTKEEIFVKKDAKVLELNAGENIRRKSSSESDNQLEHIKIETVNFLLDDDDDFWT